MDAHEDKVKVLFIGGPSRTGSTLLDRMLGQIDGFFSVGELRHIWERGLTENQLCGCGAPLCECGFWSAVLRETFGTLDEARVAEIRALKESVDHLKYTPQLLASRKPRIFQRRLDEYSQILDRLYKSIKRISGCRVIVDSSKYPTHGIILNMMPSVDLYTVHLVRDSRAVAFSWQRRKVRPEIHWKNQHMPNYNLLVCATEWNVMNATMHMLRRKTHRYLRICYEDLMTRPRETLNAMTGLLGLENAELGFIDGRSIQLQPAHTVSGNPMRFEKGGIKVEPDIEWQHKMSKASRRLVASLTFPLLFQYGYLGRKTPIDRSLAPQGG